MKFTDGLLGDFRAGGCFLDGSFLCTAAELAKGEGGWNRHSPLDRDSCCIPHQPPHRGLAGDGQRIAKAEDLARVGPTRPLQNFMRRPWHPRRDAACATTGVSPSRASQAATFLRRYSTRCANGTSYGGSSVKRPFAISWRNPIRGSSPSSSCGNSVRITSYPVGPRTVRTTIPHT